MANGGAARQVDYKVTVNNPFQLHQAKLHVVFICVCIVFFSSFCHDVECQVVGGGVGARASE